LIFQIIQETSTQDQLYKSWQAIKTLCTPLPAPFIRIKGKQGASSHLHMEHWDLTSTFTVVAAEEKQQLK
jgi:hypothetical protein